MRMIDTVDRVFDRLLWVSPQPQPVHAEITVAADEDALADDDEAPENPADRPANRSFDLSLLISGLRCTLQYMVLPVVLPLIGLTTDATLPLVIVLDILAIVLLVRSLRYFWRVRHPRRFDMLPLSGVIFLLVLGALGFDLWQLWFAAPLG